MCSYDRMHILTNNSHPVALLEKPRPPVPVVVQQIISTHVPPTPFLVAPLSTTATPQEPLRLIFLDINPIKSTVLISTLHPHPTSLNLLVLSTALFRTPIVEKTNRSPMLLQSNLKISSMPTISSLASKT